MLLDVCMDERCCGCSVVVLLDVWMSDILDAVACVVRCVYG